MPIILNDPRKGDYLIRIERGGPGKYKIRILKKKNQKEIYSTHL